MPDLRKQVQPAVQRPQEDALRAYSLPDLYDQRAGD